MATASEAILGEVPVSAHLALGSENLRLFVTNRRLIIARMGKRGAGELAGMSLLGKFGAGLEGLLGRRSRLKGSGVKPLTPEEILAADKDNFQITHQDIVRVEVEESHSLVKFMVLTTQDKLEFQTLRRLGQVLPLLTGTLGSKVTVRKRKDV